MQHNQTATLFGYAAYFCTSRRRRWLVVVVGDKSELTAARSCTVAFRQD